MCMAQCPLLSTSQLSKVTRKSAACAILISQSSDKKQQKCLSLLEKQSSGNHAVINIHERGASTAYQLFYLILHGFYVNASAALYTLLSSAGRVRGHVLNPQMLLSINGDGA